MLCNWSTTANTLLRARVVSGRGKACAAWKWTLNGAARVPTRSIHLFPKVLAPSLAHAATSQQGNAQPNTPHKLIDNRITSKHLTSAQMSRASASAIRLSIARDAPWDAIHLWNSLRWSWCEYHPSPRFRFVKPTTSYEPIDLGQAVSLSLPAHTLLHGFLRIGQYQKAAKLAHRMMEDGVVLRTRSFEALLRGLHPRTVVPGVDRTLFNRAKHVFPRSVAPKGAELLNVRNVMPADPLARFAVRLMLGARKHRWQRTQAMYDTVISTCLVQGEIIVASLLLFMLIKEFQLWHASQQLPKRLEADGHGEQTSVSRYRMSQHFSFQRPEATFIRVVEFIGEHTSGDADDLVFGSCTQALAHLAGAMDEGKLPLKSLHILLKALYTYPRNDVKVWVGKGDLELNAYDHFNRVLRRFILSLPSRRPEHSAHTANHPLLTVEVYNCLLHYALRKAYSPGLAQRVVTHMTTVRDPPCAPNTVTYSILLRAGTLMRRNDLSESVLQVLRRKMEPDNVDSSIPPVEQDSQTPPADHYRRYPDFNTDRPSHHSTINSLVRRTTHESFTVPDTAESLKSLKGDIPLIVAYITHLVSSGRSDAVADVLFRIIPELAAIDHPEWGAIDTEGRTRLRREAQTRSVARAVELGPYFFAAILNALNKGGKTGLAERMWQLAQTAEAASWETETPWFLTIHAYTSMLQAYAKEASRGLQMRSVRSRLAPPNAEWEPKSPADKNNAVGWARYVMSQHEDGTTPDRRRSVNGARLGLELYRSMYQGSRAVYEALQRKRDGPVKLHKGAQTPVPDARFFNAALDIFGRHSGMHMRRSLPLRRLWRSRLRRARLRFLRDGTTSRWAPELEEIVQDMAAAGYAVPIGFRTMLVGRWEQPPMDEHAALWPDAASMRERPPSFGRVRRPRFKPHAAPTVKTKGMPVGSR